MSDVRIKRSTPAEAKTCSRYLFQSCVNASEGCCDGGRARFDGAEAGPKAGGACNGIVCTRWFVALDGVLRSKRRKRESDDTALRREGFEG